MPAPLSSSHRLWLTIGLLAGVTLAIWLPRAFSLDKFAATDEVVWLWRSANFYYSLGQRDYAATSFNRSPGVVTMWVETAAFLLDFPQYRGFGQGWLDKYALFEALAHAKGVEPHDLLVTSRKLMMLLKTAVLAVCYLYARKLFGTWTALVGFLLIAFDPFHSAITRLAHLDGPIGIFSFLSLLAFLGFTYSGRRSLDLLISAAAAGLAILAKIPGFILIPTVALIALWDFWVSRREAQASSKAIPGNVKSGGWLEGLIKPLTIWGVALLVTIFVFFPAMWVKPVQTFQWLASSPFRDAERVLDKTTWATGEQADEQGEVSAKIASQPLDYLARYPRRYLWRVTPLILGGLLLAAAAYVSKTGVLAGATARKTMLGLLLYVILYTVLMTIPPKTSEKYYLPVYGVLDLAAGIGWYGVGPFSYYFAGEVVPLYGSQPWTALQGARLQEADYLVVYVNQWKRKLPAGLFAWLEGLQPEHTVWYDGIELARIYNVKSLPAAMFSANP